MFIENNNVLIRNATLDDVEILKKWWNNGLVMEHAGFPNGLKTNSEKIMNEINNNTEGNRRLIIEYENIKIGEMCYREVDDDVVEIGIKICEFDYQNKGIGKIALSLLINELFNMRYKKIVLDTNPNNLRARHVYQQLGFKEVGIRKDSWTDQLGILQSAVDYELIKEEFVDYSDY